jgi:hypothetical protein
MYSTQYKTNFMINSIKIPIKPMNTMEVYTQLSQFNFKKFQNLQNNPP